MYTRMRLPRTIKLGAYSEQLLFNVHANVVAWRDILASAISEIRKFDFLRRTLEVYVTTVPSGRATTPTFRTP